MNVIAVVFIPAQIVSSEGSVIVGNGSTEIEKFCAVPVQPFNVGVATKLPVSVVAPALVPVKAAMFPAPEVPMPIVPSELVQLTVAVPGDGLKFIALVFALSQTVWLVTVGMLGIGSTVMEKFCGVPTQPFSVGVATKFPVRVEDPVLVPVNDAMSPEPAVPIPIVPSEFVQLTVEETGL